MGSRQSTPVNAGVSSINSLTFTYNCNAEVADFINKNPQYNQELTNTVGNYVQRISLNCGKQGEVQLIPKLNASSSDISECEQKLDDFFDGFLSFEEKLDKTIPRQTLHHILNSQGSRCATTENAFKNTISITGRSADVKNMVKILRDAQFSPPPAPRTPTPPPTLVSSTSAPSSVEEKSIEIKGFKDDVPKCETAIKEQIEEATITREITPELCRTRHIQCKEHSSKFILKHLSPPTLKVSTSKQKLVITGNTDEVDKFVESLKGNVKSEEVSFAAPELSAHISSDQWQGFVKLLEDDLRCTIWCDEAQSRQQPLEEEEEEEIASPYASNRGDFRNDHAKEARYGSVSVSVCHGDITEENVDVIINGVMDLDFDLSRGTVSSALLKRAGSKMQEECKGAVQSSSTMWFTRGWNLPCNCVIHIVTPSQADKLTERIKRALDYAELLKATSVSLPTLGAGGIGVDSVAVASAISKAFVLFARDKPRYVNVIRLVVFEKSLVDLFQTSIVHVKETMGLEQLAVELAKAKVEYLQDYDVYLFEKILARERVTLQALEEKEEKIASPSASNRGDSKNDLAKEARYGSISVSVCHGDVTVENVDVIINGVMDRDFDLSRGTVSSALLKRAGSKMQKECKEADKLFSTMQCTRGWNLSCDHVIHIVTPNHADKLTERIKGALDYAELLKATSVSLPTLGAGGRGIKVVAVASAISKAFELFAREKPRYVKVIRLVVFEKSLVDLFRTSIVQGKETMGFGKRAVELAEAKVVSLQDDDVVVLICSDDSKCLASAKEKIVNHMSTVIVVEKMKVEILSELDDNDRLDIFEAALKHKASVAFNYTAFEIVLTGLSNNVSKLHADIRELLFELREATTISKIIVWKWAGASNIYNALPLRVSRAIEKEYEKTKSGVTSVTLYGSPMVVNFSSKSYDFKRIGGMLKREDSDKIPSDWEDMLGKHWMKVSLDQNSAEYNRVLQLFESSSPTHSHVISIERVQNPSLFKQYLIKKSEVERHMMTNHSAERELFHGTSQLDADKICADGFDRNFAGKNATSYGKGCYFAVNSSYSVRYTGGTSVGVRCVFLARVLTGDFCKGHTEMKGTPEKLHSGDTVRKYDSVVDNEKSPNIFVVFKDSSVYPYYLISFS